MNKSIDLTYEASVECSNAAGVKALILYEDLDTGLRAKDSLDRLSRQLECDEELSTELYRLDLLGEPLGREMAAIEAAERDIIIVSLHGKDGLPEVVHDWMERWLKHKEARPYALGILLDPEVADEGTVTGVFNAMRRIADLGDVDLFCGFCEPATTSMNNCLTELNEKTYNSLQVFEDVLHQREPQQWGGINE